MLESVVHETASFLTLTYSDENLPEGGSVHPPHLRDFLKRYRKRLDKPVRFFGVGEYGDKSERPHYHLAMFGDDCSAPGTDPLHRLHPQRFERRVCHADLAWPFGNVHVGTLTYDSAQYIAGYTTKKMTGVMDERLHGRHPEFARMSLRPGIGAPAVTVIAAALQCRAGWDDIEDRGDVPHMLRNGGRDMPLGRYMRQRLRASLEWDNTDAPLVASYKISLQKMQKLQTYIEANETSQITGLPDYGLARIREAEADTQRALNMVAKHKVYGSKKL